MADREIELLQRLKQLEKREQELLDDRQASGGVYFAACNRTKRFKEENATELVWLLARRMMDG